MVAVKMTICIVSLILFHISLTAFHIAPRLWWSRNRMSRHREAVFADINSRIIRAELAQLFRMVVDFKIGDVPCVPVFLCPQIAKHIHVVKARSSGDGVQLTLRPALYAKMSCEIEDLCNVVTYEFSDNPIIQSAVEACASVP